VAQGSALLFLSGSLSGAARDCAAVDVTQAAGEVSRLVHEARDLHLPVEPGVREGRDVLVRWAVLLEEVLPCPCQTGNSRMHQRPPGCPGAAVTDWRC